MTKTIPLKGQVVATASDLPDTDTPQSTAKEFPGRCVIEDIACTPCKDLGNQKCFHVFLAGGFVGVKVGSCASNISISTISKLG